MKNVAFPLLLLLYSISPIYAQDEITFRSGDILKAQVIEIGSDEIVYKKFDNLSGPSYTVKKNLVFMIKYKNGAKDVFEAETAVKGTPDAVAPSDDTPATIYFYRPSKVMGGPNKFIVGTFVPDEVIVLLKNGHWFKSYYRYTGQREFVHGFFTINENKLAVDIEPGKTYYIRCSAISKMFLTTEMELVDEVTGLREMSGLKEQKK